VEIRDRAAKKKYVKGGKKNRDRTLSGFVATVIGLGTIKWSRGVFLFGKLLCRPRKIDFKNAGILKGGRYLGTKKSGWQ
jgi:hypothetical protein